MQSKDYDPFEQLAEDIAKYSENGKTIIMGDFNAREQSDRVTNDRCSNIPLLRNVIGDSGIPER